jgi:hypothetical protein
LVRPETVLGWLALWSEGSGPRSGAGVVAVDLGSTMSAGI